MAWACKEQSTNEHPLSCSQCRTLHYANDYTMIAHRKAALESDCCFDGTQRGLHTQAEGHASDGTAQCREVAHLCDKKSQYGDDFITLSHRGAISQTPLHFNGSRGTSATCTRWLYVLGTTAHTVCFTGIIEAPLPVLCVNTPVRKCTQKNEQLFTMIGTRGRALKASVPSA